MGVFCTVRMKSSVCKICKSNYISLGLWIFLIKSTFSVILIEFNLMQSELSLDLHNKIIQM